MLHCWIERPDRVREKFKKVDAPKLEQQHLRMIFDHSDSKIRIRYTFTYLDESTFLALVTLLIVDDSLPYGRNLRRCRACAKLFLATQGAKGGPKRRTFCTKECMSKAHDRGASERVKEARKKKKAPKLRRRHK